MLKCHKSWRNLVDKAEQGEFKSNLSVSRLSDLASDVETDSVADHFGEEEDPEGEEEEEQDYPASLIA